MSHVIQTNSSQRRILLWSGLSLAIAGLAWQWAQSGGLAFSLPLYDFVEYWAAGHLNVHGENPYDPQRVHELERQVGRTADGVLMWNPPWTLTLVMPLGLLDCRVAHLLWLLLQLAVVLFCADALWHFHGGSRDTRWMSWLLAFTFLPTFFALTAGQISPLLLLGVVGFLLFERQGRHGLAGASVVLLAIKPHLVYLFWLALLLWAIDRKHWRVLVGGVVTGLIALAIPLLFNPQVLGQYWHTLSTQPPSQYRSPTLGTVLRLVFGEEQFRLQFVALLPGLIWLVPYWMRHRHNWIWSERMPMLLLVSLLTAAYGAWPFDLVLLLLPILQMAVLLRQLKRREFLWGAAFYLAVNGLALVLIACRVSYFWFIWMTPALLLGYLLAGSTK